MFASHGKNKFQTGKEAKKVAAALKAEREAVSRLLEDPEEKAKSEALLAEYREKRGPSLMEAHLDKLGKKPKIHDTRMKAFDHEKVVALHNICSFDYSVIGIFYSSQEMGGNRKMNRKDVEGMVQQSKELDTRFDKASVQKSFL